MNSCPKCGTTFPIVEETTVAPRGFSAKKNIVIILLAALLVLGAGAAVTVTAVTHSVSYRVSHGLKLAERYLSEQNYRQAVIEFLNVLEIEPMNVDAYLGLADAYIGLGDADKAIEALQNGAERTDSIKIRQKLAELYLSEKEYEKAVDEGLIIIETDPTIADVYIGLADAYLGTDDIDAAAGALIGGYERTGSEKIKQKLDKLNEFEQKIGGLLDTLENYPMNIDIYIEIAEEYVEIGDIAKAIGVLREGLEKTGSEKIRLMLAQLYLAEKKYDPAVSEFLNIIQNDQTNADVYIGLAEAYLGLKNNNAAVDILEKGLERTNSDKIRQMLDRLTKPAEVITPPSSGSSETGKPGSKGYVKIAGTEVKAGVASLVIYNKEAYDNDRSFTDGTLDENSNRNFVHITEPLTPADIENIVQLTQLKTLYIGYAEITEIAPFVPLLKNLPNLNSLTLTKNPITDLTSISELTNISRLTLSFIQTSDLSPLAQMDNLTWLSVSSSRISDISPLANMTNLETLMLEINKISDITPLANLTNLTRLSIYNNMVSDVTPLANLTNLTYLRVDRNENIGDSEIEWLQNRLPGCEIK